MAPSGSGVTLPPVEQVRPGLWSIPVPIPINPLRYVLVYALQTDGGVVLVDAGWDTAEAWEALTSGLVTAGTAIDDVVGVLVTHIHPDHYGLAARVREASGCWIALHPADAGLLDERYIRVDALMKRMLEWLRRAGAPEESLDDLTKASLPVRPFVTVAQPDLLLEDGDRPPVPGWHLVAVHTPGHSPGHLCFHEPDRRLVLTGDHVLPRITPNVSVHAQSGPDPLGDFLTSLRRVRDLAEDLSLPAHEWRFRGLAARVDELVAHHEGRLDTIEQLVADGAETAWAVSERMPWSRPWATLETFMRRLAVGEVVAHLIVLADRGRLTRHDGVPERWTPRER